MMERLETLLNRVLIAWFYIVSFILLNIAIESLI